MFSWLLPSMRALCWLVMEDMAEAEGDIPAGDIPVAATMVAGMAIMAADIAGVDTDITAVGIITGATIMEVTTAAITVGAGRIMGLDGAMDPTIRATTGRPVIGTGNGTLIMEDG